MFVTLRRAAARRALVAAVALTGVLVSPLAAAADPLTESAAAPDFALAPELPTAASLRDVTNSYRSSAGVAGLTLVTQLTQAAQIRAQEMVANGYFAHRRPNGTSPSTVLAQVGYGWNAWGENLYMSSYDPAPSSVVGAWMNSSGHRANMLSSTFTQVGFGSATTPNFAGQGPRTIVVAIYARPSATSLPQRPSVALSFTATSPAAGQVRLSWAAPSSNGGAAITQYGYQRSSNGGATWTGGYAGTANARSVLISGLTPGATYQFKLAALNSAGWGTFTSPLSVRVMAARPSVALSFTATSPAAGQVRLSWAAPSSNGGAAITQYGYQRSSNGGATWTGGYAGTANARSVLISGLTPGATYQFKLAALNSAGWGTFTSPLSVRVMAARPSAPPTLIATPLTNGQVRLDWAGSASDGGSPIIQYGYHRSSDGGRTWIGGYGGGPGARSVTVVGLTPGVTYQFRVASLNSAGWSSMSPIATVRSVAALVASSEMVATTTVTATTSTVPPPTTTSTTEPTTAAPTTSTTTSVPESSGSVPISTGEAPPTVPASSDP